MVCFFVCTDIHNMHAHKYVHMCTHQPTQGASVVVYRSLDIRKYQIFAYAEWPGGLFGSPSMAGTRPGSSV